MANTLSQKRANRIGFLFILPSIIAFTVFVLLPILLSFFMSFTSWDIVSGIKNIKPIGFGNFRKMFSDSYFLTTLQNNMVYTVLFVPLTVVTGLLLAVAMNHDIYGKTGLRAIFFLPYVTNIVAISIVWMALMQPYNGPINNILMSLGVENPPMWLASSKTAMISIVIVNVWLHTGYALVLFLGALQGVPKDLYEAADIDGASSVKRFFSITIPMISPTTFFVLITTMIDSFKVFGTVNLMTQGGPNGDATSVIVFNIYQNAFKYYKMGYASAMSWVLFAMVFIVTMIQWRGQKRWVGYNL